jgi:nitrogen-specific signal transduction histidine kinase
MTTDQYLRIFESLPLGVVVIDLYGQIQTMNGYAKNVLDPTGTSIKNMYIHTLMESLPIDNFFQSEHPDKAGRLKISHNGKMLEITFGRLKEEKEAVAKVVLTLQDITEMEKIQAAEKNNEKRAFINELSADIAHEIRNPLGSIELLASLLKKESNREKDTKRATQIMAAVETVEDAISRLIHRNEKDRLTITNLNIHDLLKEITLFSERIIDGRGVFLSVSYADVEPVIKCNADMMKQVFLYLILNAIKDDGYLDIITHYIEQNRIIEIHFIERSGPDPENGRCRTSDRLLRVKEDRWGLGLAIVHKIVNMCHGWMRIEYHEGVGVESVLSFPSTPE